MALWRKPKDASAYVKNGQYEKAIELYRSHIQQKPWDLEAFIRLADVFALIGSKEKAIDIYRAIAEKAVEDGSLLKAIGMSKRIVKLDSSPGSAHLALARLYQEKGLLDPEGGVSVESGEGNERDGHQLADSGLSAELVVTEWKGSLAPDELARVWDPAGDFPQKGPGPERTQASESYLDLSAEDLGFLEEEQQHIREFQKPAGRVPWFSDLTAEEFATSVEHMTLRSFRDKDTVFKEGDEGSGFFFVLDGAVAVYSSRAHDDSRKLFTVKEGAFLGEHSFLSGQPREVTVIAEGDTEVLELTKDQLEQVTNKHPRVQKVIDRFYQGRVTDAKARVHDALQKNKE